MCNRRYKQNELISRDTRPLKRKPYNKYGFIFTSDFPITKPQFMSHSEERNDIVGVRCFFFRDEGFLKGNVARGFHCDCPLVYNNKNNNGNLIYLCF